MINIVNGKTLYAVAWELREKKRNNIIRCGFEYLHAVDATSAKMSVSMGKGIIPPNLKLNIPWAAPAVGWFVHDKHGEKLSSDGKTQIEETEEEIETRAG